MEKCTIVLIDTISIQQYIFGSNKLKDNLGASHIIENLLYGKIMSNTVEEVLVKKPPSDWMQWSEKCDEIKILKGYPCEIGYIGGGNAFLLWSNAETAIAFIRKFSKKAMQYFPGLRLGMVLKESFDLKGDFLNHKKELHRKLQITKSLHYTNTTVFKHGIVEDCTRSNEAQEKSDPKNSEILVSGLTISKLAAAELSQEELIEKYKEELADIFIFTDELANLGQPKDKGYIAVVHIDGNGIGQEFATKGNLKELRKLSAGVSKLAQSSMEKLIKYIVGLYIEEGSEIPVLNNTNGFELKPFVPKNPTEKEKIWLGRKQLPIRPIITGGDDITFVCEGRLGIHLAEKFIDFFSEQSEEIFNRRLTACAGIAIVKTKYPFYRAYHLAEELIQQAKREFKNNNKEDEECSWLSYLISSGGYSGELETVIKKKFEIANGRLTKIPYPLQQEHGFVKVKKMIHSLTVNDETKWPRNKIMELRDILEKDEASRKYFLQEIEAKGLKLPVDENTSGDLWNNRTTIYYDPIELLGFYPQELLLK